ncbi:hypothetical protein ABZZ80_40350, partial [Streptomyces sp. NPDC006356]
MSTEAYVYDAIRTPRGRGKANGALHGTKPIDLVVGLIHEIRARFPGLRYLGGPLPERLEKAGGHSGRQEWRKSGYRSSG